MGSGAVRVRLMPMFDDRTIPAACSYAAWALTGIALVLVLVLGLLPAMLAGMLVYELVLLLAPHLGDGHSHRRARVIAVFFLSVLVVGAVALAIAGALAFFRSDVGSIPALLTKMAEIIA